MRQHYLKSAITSQTQLTFQVLFPLPVDCQHVNSIKHRPVGAHKASVSTRQKEQVEF